jgi:hypothetical protein
MSHYDALYAVVITFLVAAWLIMLYGVYCIGRKHGREEDQQVSFVRPLFPVYDEIITQENQPIDWDELLTNEETASHSISSDDIDET